MALPLPLTWPRFVITHSIFSLAQRGELPRVRVRVRAQGLGLGLGLEVRVGLSVG